MSRFVSFLSDRLAWQKYLRPFLEKRLPSDLNWTDTLGTVCALILVLEAVTGMCLAMYYNPSPDHAYRSINYIMNDVHLGAILRGIHHWGAGAMVLLVAVHMVVNFFYGAFKPPRELTWIVGVCLLFLTLGFGFTGYLLPWDQKAYWATVVGTNIPLNLPLVGKLIRSALLGGDHVSGLTLTRFYAIHALILPALTAVFVLVHIYLVRVHDIAGHGSPGPSGTRHTYRFFPEHLWKSSIAFGTVFLVILLLALFAHVPLEAVAMTPDPSYLPRPEWYFMWLFELLTFFTGRTEIFGSIVVPLLVVVALFSVPFLTRTSLRGAADRPLGTAIGVSSIVGVVYLTIMGFEGARPYGQTLVVPDRQLTPTEARGLELWVANECAYCHTIMGRGGRREGPDLSNVIARGRTKEWIVNVIRDPQSVSRWSIMPKYNLTEEDLSALADYLLSLDFAHYGVRTMSRDDFVKQKIP